MSSDNTPQEVEAARIARRQFSRTERALSREIIADAAAASGMRRLEFVRAVNRGDADATAELKLSLASHDVAREIDVDRLAEIFQMILDFIRALLLIFGGI